ncbi:TetR/AcrR family transcriptional regulator [Erythrobacter aurantius]|uniref:TetR/AcrR family transcriptional regulator n=1 Tax=Erythrobacter aurantius TaxID=2909249 RepID=UPI002079B666|nr:TetR/AcrR family transcriptional regulator [Erythrobacter aurantius]
MTAKAKTKATKRRVGRPPASEKGDRRNALLDSAISLFSEKGFSSVELREIAAEAGVTVGLIRHYYGTKDDLIDAAVAQVTARLQQVFEKILSGLEADSAEDFIDGLNERTGKFLLPEYKLLFFLKHMVIELPDKSAPVFKTYFDLFQSELNGLEAIGKINPMVNKVWLSFMLMFVQLGPVFLSRQIEDILGKSVSDPNAAMQRAANNAFILKYGLVERD